VDPSISDKITRIAMLSGIFTPRTPVARKDRFAGRIDQVIQVTSALVEPGSHVALYGERGVGKTSLANVLSAFLTPFWPENQVVRVNCTTGDTFKTIWTKVFGHLHVQVPEEWAYGSPDPDEIRSILQDSSMSAVLILDEYDRMEDAESQSLMADAIKAFSDHGLASKLVIVGVADSIDQLIGEHASVQRALVEVAMPRMSQDESTEIIDSGLTAANMTATAAARRRISLLAEGLPHYVHLLALTAARTALQDDREEVRLTDVQKAVEDVVKTHSLVREYQTAIQSPRRDTLFANVLLACALAEKNRLGYFTAGAVKEPLSRIMGRPYDIPAFARHLTAFLEPERGCVLKREGTERRYTYRFTNPLLQPFTVLSALASNELPSEYRDQLLGSDDETETLRPE
jgi:Cdc6-like AAA superfamily ATPase